MIEYNEEVRQWINEHINEDPTKLRLTWHNKAPWIAGAINHIENYKNTLRKFNIEIPGIENLLPRFMPIKVSTEQATSAMIALLHFRLSGLENTKNATVLDMTCGLGIDSSFLATSPSTSVTAIELNEDIARVADINFSGRDNITVIHGNSVDFLSETEHHYNLIFIDPARRDEIGKRVYNLHDCSPDVTEIMPLLKTHADRIMIKMSPMLDVTQTIADLPGITSLNIIEERNECRELLAIIDTTLTIDEPQIKVWRDNNEVFSFTLSQEKEAVCSTSLPLAGQFLYEPSAATMKAGPFKLLSEKFDLSQLNNNTHLYTSSCYYPEFPGYIYNIAEILPYSSSNIKKLARQKLKADVAVRNFSISAQQLARRLNVIQSGPTRIMGVTLCDNKPYLLLLERAL